MTELETHQRWHATPCVLEELPGPPYECDYNGPAVLCSSHNVWFSNTLDGVTRTHPLTERKQP